MTEGCAVGFEEGLRWSKDHTNLHSDLPVHDTARILGCMWISWLVARVGSQGSAKGERR